MLRAGNCATATAQFLVNFLMQQICLLCSDSDNASVQKATDSTHVCFFSFFYSKPTHFELHFELCYMALNFLLTFLEKSMTLFLMSFKFSFFLD